MSDPHVQEAMTIMYGPILDTWEVTLQDPECVLLRLLASVVYHMEWIKGIPRTSSNHPFNSIPLIFDFSDLVAALSNLVTTKPSCHMIEVSGNSPPPQSRFSTAVWLGEPCQFGPFN